ncbi:cupin domain-containing protein [Candidatus Saccharibacteria bacterium]|nr:cupin domain-containing protein [Candidatus Saccharibacteria bacterium]
MARITDINQQAIANEYYRRVVATSEHLQVVIMSIPPGGEVGSETHPDNDQALYLVAGSGTSVLDGDEQPFAAGDIVVVPAGTKHNFIASSDEPLKIITTYGPAHHPDGLIHKTKAEADAQEN